VSLTSTQLDKFVQGQTGVVDLSGATVSTNQFLLAATGNTFNLAGVTTTTYTVTGAGSNDQLTNGGGVDQFRYTSVASGQDTIHDFSGTTDFGGGAGQGDKLAFIGLPTGALPAPTRCRSIPTATVRSTSRSI